MVRAGDLNVEDPGSNPRPELLNKFVLGDHKEENFTTLCKQTTGLCLLPVGILKWERGDFNMTLKSHFRGVVIRYYLYHIILLYVSLLIICEFNLKKPGFNMIRTRDLYNTGKDPLPNEL